MNTPVMKYQANWTEIVGVVRTRFCGQTDRRTPRPPDRQADSSIPPPPTNFVCWGWGGGYNEYHTDDDILLYSIDINKL